MSIRIRNHLSIRSIIFSVLPHAPGNTVPTPLKPCPNSPNCVSSVISYGKQAIAPLQYSVNQDTARQILIQILKSEKGAAIVDQRDDYIHVEYLSSIFKFTDDVEFYFPSDQAIIHVRSASRKGFYDFGVNRKRIEEIRQHFLSAMPH